MSRTLSQLSGVPEWRRILVCGGRDFTDYAAVEGVLRLFLTSHGLECIIHGAARGADSLAAKFCAEHLVPQRPHPADWQAYGRAAGHIRNALMLKQLPDGVVAFPGGRGTADMIKQAIAARTPVLRVAPDGAMTLVRHRGVIVCNCGDPDCHRLPMFGNGTVEELQIQGSPDRR